MKKYISLLSFLIVFALGQDYYDLGIGNTGVSQLIIFQNSITSLEANDEIGIFDSDAIVNSGDCSSQNAELLVGSGIWLGSQLEISSVGSVDNCAFGGSQLPGFQDGNSIVIRVYRPSTGVEYSATPTFSAGTGTFGDLFMAISGLTLEAIGEICEDDDVITSGFGGCGGAVAALGCDFVFAGSPISELCPVSCDNCAEDILGCTNSLACNFDADATLDDGSCLSNDC